MLSTKIKRLNIAFVTVIIISIIIPLSLKFSFILLMNENILQNQRDAMEDGLIILFYLFYLFFAIGIITYIIGCINLASVKGYSKILGFVLALLPIIGILILMFLRNKNKNDFTSFEDSFKKLYLAAVFATILPFFITPHLISQIFSEANTELVIKNSGFSDEEAMELIEALEKQYSVYRSELFSIEKIDDTTANIKYDNCGSSFCHGASFSAKKNKR